MEQWQPVRTDNITDDRKFVRALRLNSLGSLFYFTFVTLKRRRLTEGLHKPFCLTLEREHLKDVIEMPRDHFKSTCAGEGLPMWKVLPISQQDVDEMGSLGYSDEFLRWMIRTHDPNKRNLLVSENITNAAKLGRKVRWHYESNGLYREVFPETLPDTSCVWTDYSLHVKRPSGGTSVGGAHGEGTFDFMGVGSAIQSRHYNGIIIQDDLVGKKAVESESIMEKTIEYHQLLINATETEDPIHEADELVIGNRWGYFDLNSYLKEEETWFRFESHSALGGCCRLHPANQPIFPEEFSFEKLERRKKQLGNYKFSCQFLNNPASPDDADFSVGDLNYYRLDTDSQTGEYKIIHEVHDGMVMKDLKAKRLEIAMTVDPNHSGNAAAGRCRHAIIVIGRSTEDYYLLEEWVEAASYEKFYSKIFEIATRWNLRRVGVETVAAQKYIKHHIETIGPLKGYPLRVDELKGEVEAPDGTLTTKKEWRIRNVIAPILEFGHLWVQRRHSNFINELQTFPKGKYKDALDAFAYAPQLVRQPMDMALYMKLLQNNRNRMNQVGQPYSVGAQRYHA